MGHRIFFLSVPCLGSTLEATTASQRFFGLALVAVRALEQVRSIQFSLCTVALPCSAIFSGSANENLGQTVVPVSS